MASFERNWNESTPGGTQDRSLADDYIRYSKVNISDRLKALIYGFISGENDGVQGCKNLAFKQQSSDPTVAADTITLYAKNVGANNELFIKDEADSVVQLTTAGKIGAGGVTLLAGKDLIGSGTSDITINTDKFTVAGATGNTVVAGTLGVTGVATLGDTSALATSGAPAADAQIANKKYVDDLIAAEVTARSFGTWTNKDSLNATLVKDGVYKAGSDGFVLASNVFSGTIVGLTDGDSPPTTWRTRQNQGSNVSHGIMMPVKKDDYWKVTDGETGGAPTIYWLPIGSGTCVKQ